MSVATDIEAAITTVLGTVDDTPVRPRKVPGVLDGDPATVIVLTVDRIDARPLDFENDRVDYLARIARAERHGGKAGDRQAGLTWLESARRKLHGPGLAGVPEVVNAVPQPGEPFAPPPAASGLNLSSLAVRFTAIEPRG